MKTIRIFLFFTILSASALGLKAQTNLFSLAYSTSSPLGATGDYISNFSWRGFALENRYFVERDLSVGFYLGWNVFNETEEDKTESFDNAVLYGNQYRYINAFPVLINTHYHFLHEEVVRPYIGAGAGLFRQNKRTEMGIYQQTTKSWQFGVQPEAGIWIDVMYGMNFIFGAKYNYAFGTKKADALSYLNINAGMTFVY